MMRCANRLALAIALLLAAGGCSRSPAAAVAEPDVRSPRIDAALAKATGFLRGAQSPDGAWRSDVYATFKEGDALTPLVLNALIALPDSQANRAAMDSGRKYLAKLMPGSGSAADQSPAIVYPVYTAAGAVMALRGTSDAQLAKSRGAWLEYLKARQLAETRGWQRDDPYYGGWGYAKELPNKPPAGQSAGPLVEPNLSATVFALEALRGSGLPADDPTIRAALHFIERCQNYSDSADAADRRFDDGGFFFIQNDVVRNKAGAVGVDASGRQRFASYGSTTADGLRALLLCGLQASDPRVMAARTWLERNFSAAEHPGGYSKDREAARPALYFYYCGSVAKAMRAIERTDDAIAQSFGWRNRLADELLARQQPGGSWINAAVDVREDDPLVATSFAVAALAICRERPGK